MPGSSMPGLLLLLLLLLLGLEGGRACQLPSDWRPLSESCRAELAETIVLAKVLALHPDAYSPYNHLPWQDAAAGAGLLYAAEVELLCDQAWGSMLEVPAGSRLNLTGLGYFACHSHTVVQGYAYYFFLRMDENYNLLPHGVNFQDAIFPDTQENRRMFSSLFQFSNCTQGQQALSFASDWEIQEDNREHKVAYVDAVHFNAHNSVREAELSSHSLLTNTMGFKPRPYTGRLPGFAPGQFELQMVFKESARNEAWEYSWGLCNDVTTGNDIIMLHQKHTLGGPFLRLSPRWPGQRLEETSSRHPTTEVGSAEAAMPEVVPSTSGTMQHSTMGQGRPPQPTEEPTLRSIDSSIRSLEERIFSAINRLQTQIHDVDRRVARHGQRLLSLERRARQRATPGEEAQ